MTLFDDTLDILQLWVGKICFLSTRLIQPCSVNVSEVKLDENFIRVNERLIQEKSPLLCLPVITYYLYLPFL